MAIRTYGPNAVDWEARVDVDRLRTDRLDRLQAAPGRLRARVAADLRLLQYPLHDGHAHRYLGDGQADPLCAAAAGSPASGLGLRVGGQASPALQPLARLRPKAGRPRALRGSEGWPIRRACRDLHACVARSIRTQASRKRSPAKWRWCSASTSWTRSRSGST